MYSYRMTLWFSVCLFTLLNLPVVAKLPLLQATPKGIELSQQRIVPIVRPRNLTGVVSAAAIDAWMRTKAVQYGLRSGVPGKPLVLGINVASHSAGMAVTLGGSVLCVIEFERFHKIKDFGLDIFLKHWEGKFMENAVSTYVVPVLVQLCEIVTPKLNRIPKLDVWGNCELEYDAAVYVDPFPSLISSLQHVVKASEWMMLEHHYAHGVIGWISSPFYNQPLENKGRTSLVLSYDGQGSDGALRTFIAREGSALLEPYDKKRVKNSYGHTYRALASTIREIAWGGGEYGKVPPCDSDSPLNSINHFTRLGNSLPGTFMAYAALGTPRQEWLSGALRLLEAGVWVDELFPSPLGNWSCRLFHLPVRTRHGPAACTCFSCLTYSGLAYYGAEENFTLSRQIDRDLAATFQLAFEISIVNVTRNTLDRIKAEYAAGTSVVQPPTSLVVTGGCGLNVKANSALARALQLPTHVPSAPGDEGLALGAAWRVAPPPPQKNPQMIHFLGAPLTRQGRVLDSKSLQAFAERWGGSNVFTVDWLAQALLNGAVIAVARGHAELGPRALGHRSLISGANYAKQKDRLNRLKSRQWYRPVSPIVRYEDLEQIFQPGPDLLFGAPYMSFAPPLQSWVAEELPALSHLDNTARPNGVRQADDPWMHSLLTAVRNTMEKRYQKDFNTGEKDGTPLCQMADRNCTHAVGALINTSLNPKGIPIVSDVLDALLMFCHGFHELDFVLLEEEWIFHRADVVSRGLCN